MLHITNGDSAAGTLRETTLGGDVLAWRDTLHEGPVPAVPRRELLRTRARFLAECGAGPEDELFRSLERRDRQLRDTAEVVLWFEHDLYDQLQLIDVLSLAAAEGKSPDPSQTGRERLPRRSSPRSGSRMLRFSATPGSSERSARSRASSRRTTGSCG